MRSSGIFLHVSSLPGDEGIGTLGEKAYDFINFLYDSGQKYWQILPMCPTGMGGSPYKSPAAFAGNYQLIDIEFLVTQGLIDYKDYKKYIKSFKNNTSKVNYDKLDDLKFDILEKAFKQGYNKVADRVEIFRKENASWVEDYALYMALKIYVFPLKVWQNWDEPIKNRKEISIEVYKEQLEDKIELFIFIQYLFFSQWSDLKKYANSKDIKIVGDIPIYVDMDSVDTWVYPDIFMFDDDRNPIEIACCPPNDMHPEGKILDKPTYNWEYLKSQNYRWWLNRLQAASRMYDVVRINHFSAFDSYYALPYGKTDINVDGIWHKGPGENLFKEICVRVPYLKILAGVQGEMKSSTKDILKSCNISEIKILQRGFGCDANEEFLPHNYEKDTAVYVGTHNNPTIREWKRELKASDLRFCKKYLDKGSDESLNWAFIRTAYESVSEIAIVPMQDFLDLGKDSRMNEPTKIDNNWRWRSKESHFTPRLSRKIKKLVKLYGRLRGDIG